MSILQKKLNIIINMFTESKQKLQSPFSNLNTTAFSIAPDKYESPNVIRNLDIEMDCVEIIRSVNHR